MRPDRRVGDFFCLLARGVRGANQMKCGQAQVICVFLVLASVSVEAASDAGEEKPRLVKRIVSLSPSITETLFALGARERVVGVTQFCDYPPEAKKKPKVGGIINPSLEAIVALKPDLVVTQKSQGLSPRLRELGMATLEIENANVRELIASYHTIGAAIGTANRAAKLIQQLETKIKQIEKATKKVKRVKVLMVVGRQPLYVAGSGIFINELIAVAGGKNIFSDSLAPYPQVSLEEIIARSPEVIIEMMVMAKDKKSDRVPRKLGWERWGMIPAVASGRVYRVREDSFLRPGPRLPEALDRLVRLLHPKLKLKDLTKEKAGSGRKASSLERKQDERGTDPN